MHELEKISFLKLVHWKIIWRMQRSSAYPFSWQKVDWWHPFPSLFLLCSQIYNLKKSDTLENVPFRILGWTDFTDQRQIRLLMNVSFVFGKYLQPFTFYSDIFFVNIASIVSGRSRISPWWGANPRGRGVNTQFCQILPKTAWNWKNLDPPGGGGGGGGGGGERVRPKFYYVDPPMIVLRGGKMVKHLTICLL